jgi:hypothetical protein
VLNDLKSRQSADEQVTNGRGWSFNLDIFQIVFLTATVFPWAIDRAAQSYAGSLRMTDFAKPPVTREYESQC